MRYGRGTTAVAADINHSPRVTRFGEHLDRLVHLGQVDQIHGLDEILFVLLGVGH